MRLQDVDHLYRVIFPDAQKDRFVHGLHEPCEMGPRSDGHVGRSQDLLGELEEGVARAELLAQGVLDEEAFFFERSEYPESRALAEGEGPCDIGDAERLVLFDDELDDFDCLSLIWVRYT